METSVDSQATGGGERAAWMRVLALADADALDAALRRLGPLPEGRWLRPPQTGMAMVRARAGGTGAQFNLGEMTVTRCALALPEGVVGTAYVRGRRERHAEHAALADALLQLPAWRERVHAEVIEPLRRAHAERGARQARDAARTRVDFFTLVRGED